MRQDRQWNILIQVALYEVLIFRVVPELFFCAVFVCSFIHLSIEHVLIELHSIVDEDILFYSRKFHECVVRPWLLIQIVVDSGILSLQLLLLALTQELDVFCEFLLEFFFL